MWNPSIFDLWCVCVCLDGTYAEHGREIFDEEASSSKSGRDGKKVRRGRGNRGGGRRGVGGSVCVCVATRPGFECTWGVSQPGRGGKKVKRESRES